MSRSETTAPSPGLYSETVEKLRTRIHAHTAYANVKLEDLLRDVLGPCDGSRLVELGCGSGNLFPAHAAALGTTGLIIGLDKDRKLLDEAQEGAKTLTTPSVLLHWDFDVHPYPLLDEDVDILIAPFSAYYTNDIEAWIDDGLRLLRAKGRMILLGPTKDNARELADLNEKVSGLRSVPETDETAAKLEDELLPALRRREELEVTSTVLDRRIVFPTAEEYARYYLATWLCTRTSARIGRTIEHDVVVAAAHESSLELGKQIICIEARRP